MGDKSRGLDANKRSRYFTHQPNYSPNTQHSDQEDTEDADHQSHHEFDSDAYSTSDDGTDNSEDEGVVDEDLNEYSDVEGDDLYEDEPDADEPGEDLPVEDEPVENGLDEDELIENDLVEYESDENETSKSDSKNIKKTETDISSSTTTKKRRTQDEINEALIEKYRDAQGHVGLEPLNKELHLRGFEAYNDIDGTILVVALRGKPEYVDKYRTQNGIKENLKPISNIKEMFRDIIHRCLEIPTGELGIEDSNGKFNLEGFANHLGSFTLKVGTMCSGTESPLLALKMILEALKERNIDVQTTFNHAFSAEIVPFKQHYIQTNFAPPVLFADITELTKELPEGETIRMATTAYGGLAAVPGELDLLIAGFACVDFSPLNGNRKELEDRGESGDTFVGMREYAKHHRPKIVILENVSGAPWEHSKVAGKKTKRGDKKGLDYLMGEVGYATSFQKMDTKNYYLPHTRQRGYMICIDKFLYLPKSIDREKYLEFCAEHPLAGSFNDSEPDPYSEELKSLYSDLKMWKGVVLALKRQASVPTELLLLRSDDPQLEIMSTGNESALIRKSTEWEKCKLGHNDYREQLFLGSRRDFTNWASGGSFISEDFWKRNQKGLVERVLDTIEIAHLRNLKRGFDDRFYDRILELSQNVYRVTDKVANGIVGCLTPTGFPFLTSRGGRITGLEALILQGLGLEELDLDMLTQSNLQDMAGNAMSSTVVGVTIAAALGTFYRKFDLEGRTMPETVAPIDPNIIGEDDLIENVIRSSDYRNKLSSAQAMQAASCTRRLCSCEGRLIYKVTKFQRCSICAHTTCIECGKKPLHCYDAISAEEISNRKDPANFERLVKSSIPASVCFNLSPNDAAKLIDDYGKKYKDDVDKRAAWKKINRDLIAEVLSSEVFLRHVRRAEVWEITYDSPKAKLILTISQHKVEWLLYANVLEQPLESAQGKFFRKFPIARMRPDGDDINVGSWSLWLPKEYKFNATIQWSGTPKTTMSAQRGLHEHRGEYVYSECSLKIPDFDPRCFERDIRGQYALSQECGQAHNTLHALKGVTGQRPLLLYLEQHLRGGSPSPQKGDHYFVFSEDQHRLEKLEHRTAIASLGSEWRPPLIKVRSPEHLETDYENNSRLKMSKDLQLVDNLGQATNTYDQNDVEVRADGRWVKFGQISMNPKSRTKVKYCVLPHNTQPVLSPESLCEASELAVFTSEATLTGKISGSWNRNSWTTLSHINEASFMSEFGWALMSGSVIDGYTRLDNTWHIFGEKCASRCLSCAPPSPPLQWTMKIKKPKQDQSKRKVNHKAVPCEEPLAATEFEKRMKDRPSPFVAKFLIATDSQSSLKIGINPKTLIHRAVAMLDSSSVDEEIITSWRLVTDDNSSPKLHLREFTVLDNKERDNNPSLPSLKLRLRPEQDRALSWIMDRERERDSFTEEEVVESRLRKIGYRLEGKAARAVVRLGGLLFFDVGFGKTAITLALTQNRLESDKKLTKALTRGPPQGRSGRIALKASIIFMPTHLTQQWKGEVEKFLVKSPGQVLVIGTIASWRKLRVRDFRDAEIIIVNWALVVHSGYQDALAQFVGLVEPYDKGSSRSKRAWYEKAVSKIPSTVAKLTNKDMTPQQVWKEISADYANDLIAVDMVNAPVPTKRTRGKNYKSSAHLPALPPVRKRKHSDIDDLSPLDPAAAEAIRDGEMFDFNNISSFEEMKCPPLEIFYFARLIIDEFPYADPFGLSIMNQLFANSRLALSGKPTLTSFADVKDMAKILDIHLGTEDLSSRSKGTFKQATKDLTRSEQFLAYKATPSPAWHINRQRVAQDFLNMFARKDTVAVSNIEMVEHYKLIDLNSVQQAAYLELQQRIATTTTENLRGKNVESNAEQQIQKVIYNIHDPREGLLRAASLFSTSSTAKDGKATTDGIIKIRNDQYQNLLKQFKKLLKKAVWLEKQEESNGHLNFARWRKLVQDNNYQDLETGQEMAALVKTAQEVYTYDDWEEFYYDVKETGKKEKIGKEMFPQGFNENSNTSHLHKVVAQLRTTTTKLSHCAQTIVDHKRSMRFMEAISAVKKGSYICSHCEMELPNAGDVTILSSCGHVACSVCLEEQDEICPVDGCHLPVKKFQKVKASHLGRTETPAIDGPYGRKVDAIVQLIKAAKKRDEKVLLFTQYRKLTDAICEVLTDAEIGYKDMTVKGKNRSKLLTDFQSLDDDDFVLIMDPMQETAAGSNLTVANHVLFAHPLHVAGPGAQVRYDNTMAQAIGRSRRYGQTKKVHVHHMISLWTVDVDIIEHRTGKLLERIASNSRMGKLEQVHPGSDFVTPFSSAIAHLNFPGDPKSD